MDHGESQMIHIICLKWGTKYGAEYVNRLYRAVKRNVSPDVNYDFWCFSDDLNGLDRGIIKNTLPYGSQIESWWNKLWLFSNEMPVARGDRIFYIDLDTVITGDITDFLTVKIPNIIVLRDFYHDIARSANNIGSGLMTWHHGDYDFVWKKFIANPESAIQRMHPHGDQHWVDMNVTKKTLWQDVLPDRVVSYKVHCAGGLPPKASIICYHGQPSIPESAVSGHDCRTATRSWHVPPQPWILDHWRD